MSENKEKPSVFDDDFEVTYEEDPYEVDINDDKTKTMVIPPVSHQQPDLSIDDTQDEDFEDQNEDAPSRRHPYRPTRLAAPLQKGGNLVYRLVRGFARNLSAILIVAILVLMCMNFYRGSAPYGEISQLLNTKEMTMKFGSYALVSAFWILFELIALLWTMTKVRVKDNFGSHKEDVGRGLASFILIYLFSYASFFGNGYIPESYDFLAGAKGALDVFGSMHNVLFGLCLAGVISCLFRKYSLSL